MRIAERMAGLLVVPALVLMVACVSRSETVEASSKGELEAVGLVDIADVVPGIELDMRYATTRNFTGGRVEGYESARCHLWRPAAAALGKVERDLRAKGLGLRVFDCYRPARAVRSFVAWAADASDQRTKPTYYPNLDKAGLVPGYISDRSGHSKGATIDLTLVRCAPAGDCLELDMGTEFDFFDPKANTGHPGINAEQRANRMLLQDAMERRGFENYPMEWWHYTFRPQPPPEVFHDIQIR